MNEVKEYLTKAQFARRLGIHYNVLLRAIKAGRVEQVDRFGKTRIEYHSNRRRFIESSRNPERFMNDRAKHKGNNGRIGSKKVDTIKTNNVAHEVDLMEPPPDTDGDFRPQMSRMEAESVKQVYLAKQAKLKFLKQAGVLIETDKVKREWEEIAVRVQKAMLSIPDRVSEIFASIDDAEEIHQELTTEIHHALSSLQYRVKIEDGGNENIEDFIEEKNGVRKKAKIADLQEATEAQKKS